MAIWHDSDGSFDHFTLLPRALIEEGVVKMFAAALLEQWQEAAREGEQLDLRQALERLRDQHQGPEQMMDQYEDLMRDYDDALDHYEDRLSTHNRIVDTLNQYRHELKDAGVLTSYGREKYEAAKEALPQARERLAVAEDRLSVAIENAARQGQKIRQNLIAVGVETGSPALRKPTDPRRTDDRVAEVEVLPKEPYRGQSQPA